MPLPGKVHLPAKVEGQKGTRFNTRFNNSEEIPGVHVSSSYLLVQNVCWESWEMRKESWECSNLFTVFCDLQLTAWIRGENNKQDGCFCNTDELLGHDIISNCWDMSTLIVWMIRKQLAVLYFLFYFIIGLNIHLVIFKGLQMRSGLCYNLVQ